jgi:uncharacterized linocin/CFP29 family protein
MLSKNPLEIPSKKLSPDEIRDALRLAIIAELDAINLYLQLSRSIEDESVRKVLEDIAREEKTHVGEFLEILKRLDPEQVKELEKGAKEIKTLLGNPVISEKSSEKSNDNNNSSDDIEDLIKREFKEALTRSRILTNKLPKYVAGRGIEAVPHQRIREGGSERSIIPLSEVSYRLMISQKTIDYYKATKIFDAPEILDKALQLANSEDKKILESILGCREAKRTKLSSWDTPGESVRDIAQALAELFKEGVRKPTLVIMSPSRYAKLVATSERTGVIDLERVKALVEEIITTPVIPDDKVVILHNSKDVIEVVFGGDGEVDYIGPENGYQVFRIWSSFAVKLKDPRGIVILES